MGAESGFLDLFFVCFSCFLVAVFFGVRALMLLCFVFLEPSLLFLSCGWCWRGAAGIVRQCSCCGRGVAAGVDVALLLSGLLIK